MKLSYEVTSNRAILMSDVNESDVPHCQLRWLDGLSQVENRRIEVHSILSQYFNLQHHTYTITDKFRRHRNMTACKLRQTTNNFFKSAEKFLTHAICANTVAIMHITCEAELGRYRFFKTDTIPIRYFDNYRRYRYDTDISSANKCFLTFSSVFAPISTNSSDEVCCSWTWSAIFAKNIELNKVNEPKTIKESEEIGNF